MPSPYLFVEIVSHVKPCVYTGLSSCKPITKCKKTGEDKRQTMSGVNPSKAEYHPSNKIDAWVIVRPQFTQR